MSAAMRPPDLPRPTSFAKQTPSASSTNNKTNRNSSGSVRENSVSTLNSMASEASRENLRSVMHQRETSLTQQEYNFVSHLLTDGNEIEMTLVIQKLQDDDLFGAVEGLPTTTSTGAAAHGPSQEEADEKLSHDAADRPSSFSSIGSERRQDRLQSRRQSHRCMYGPIWKAHENGIAVSERSSRQSFLERQSVANPPTKVLMKPSLGRRKTIASIHHHSIPIFRSPEQKAARLSRHASFLGDHQCIPENPSKEVQTQSKSSTSSVCAAGQEPTLPLPPLGNNPKGVLRRMQSAPIATKSVSFNELPPPLTVSKLSTQRQVSGLGDDDDDDVAATTTTPPAMPSGVPFRSVAMSGSTATSSSIPSLHHGNSIRSQSIGSIPSLHHPRHVRSTSIGSIPSHHHPRHVRSNSIGSIPSLHHAHPIRRPSVSSFASLHHGRPIRQTSVTSVPSIHHGNPVRSNSISSQFASLELDMSSSGDQQLLVTPEVFQQQYRADMNVIQVFGTNDEEKSDKVSSISRPVLMRQTTNNTYQEGVEVSPHDGPINREFFSENRQVDWDALSRREAIDIARNYGSLVSDVGEGSENYPPTLITCVTSFDETMSEDHRDNYRGVFRGEAQQIYRSISDDDLSTFLVGFSKPTMYYQGTSVRSVEPASKMDGSSWDMESETDGNDYGQFDTWVALKDEYVNGYGGGGSLPFLILGTSADDVDCHPHVLSPPLMESLQSFFPFSLTSDNFWIKYSVVRDGGSFHTLLQQARGAQHSILAIETVDGEVFGSFTTEAWRKNWSYFGGGESFLWRMRNARNNNNKNVHSILDQAKLESEVDIFPYTGVNPCIQFCTSDKIAVGGGGPDNTKFANDPTSPIKDHEWGHGLALKRDLMRGSSSPCVTFGSPSLSSKHSDGSVFEIMNLELWTLTPCRTVEDAEKLEVGKFFLQEEHNQ